MEEHAQLLQLRTLEDTGIQNFVRVLQQKPLRKQFQQQRKLDMMKVICSDRRFLFADVRILPLPVHMIMKHCVFYGKQS